VADTNRTIELGSRSEAPVQQEASAEGTNLARLDSCSPRELAGEGCRRPPPFQLFRFVAAMFDRELLVTGTRG
jgi:hypothetical protein